MNSLSLHFPLFFRPSLKLGVKLGAWINSKIILGLLLCLVLFLLGFELFQIGEITKANYLKKAYQTELRELSEQNLILHQEVVELASLQSMEEKIKDPGFVRVSVVKYIPISDDYLVKKSR